ncbi:hypothetical protein [Geodermatophilus sp. SYSU D01105]
MLIPPATAAGIMAGAVTLAFRRWDRPRLRPVGVTRSLPVGYELSSRGSAHLGRGIGEDGAR